MKLKMGNWVFDGSFLLGFVLDVFCREVLHFLPVMIEIAEPSRQIHIIMKKIAQNTQEIKRKQKQLEFE